ncbi:MAG: polyprenyl synthetase family protein [Firmicutes bacterium]|nr:polyprenyl synthetase family protein [Bacillota bacterium]
MREIFAEIEGDLRVVEEEIARVLQSPDGMLTDAAIHLLKAGGKRLRPALALLGGRFCDFSLARVLPLAVALELVHMATLIHDDVVDAAELRRGIPTLKATRGNRFSVYAGNYLLGRALDLVAGYRDSRVCRVLAETSRRMCLGELQQICSAFDLSQTVRKYLYRIRCKTALLIAVSCDLGAYVCGAPGAVYLGLCRYGYRVGMAFQITDDVLDLAADRRQLGKPIGGDLRQGIITLPVIYALGRTSRPERLRELLLKRDKGPEELEETIALVREAGGLEYARRVARRFVARATSELGRLPDVPARAVLHRVAEAVTTRSF